MAIKEKITDYFEKYTQSLNGEKNSYLFSLREKSIKIFHELGIPTLKNEEWKYTKLNFLNNIDFEISNSAPHSFPENFKISDYYIENFEGDVLVFINGFFEKKYSRIINTEENLVVTNLNEAKEKYSNILENYLTKYTDESNNPFTALNTALANDGAVIILPKNFEKELPIHLLFINIPLQSNLITNSRNLIIVDSNSKAQFIETSYSWGDLASFHNTVSELYLKQNSEVEYYKFQNDSHSAYYIGSTQIHQEKDSRLFSTTISLAGKFIRNNLNSILDGENSEAHFNGLYFIGNEDFVDNHTLVDHAKPHCNSNENYKGIIDGKATAVFNGKIMVRPFAQKTNAYQSNKNILLSEDATINTKPQLEIFADDVKCSHGATSGYLDRDAIFYFRARGIDEKIAQSYLLNSFSSDIIETVKIDALRDLIKSEIAKKLSMNELYFCSILESNKI
ncbi:MAG: Fe-S cluster assembly protein SufD [Candidatus Kapabacteria bacterium]|nr:Fe-S cluster assembly protein SufD [Candidatus Kapabacteria bacterium]